MSDASKMTLKAGVVATIIATTIGVTFGVGVASGGHKEALNNAKARIERIEGKQQRYDDVVGQLLERAARTEEKVDYIKGELQRRSDK